MSTPMPEDPGSGSSSEEMAVEPIVEQVGQAMAIIDSVISSTVIWNKHQCKRITDRYKDIGKRFESMGGAGSIGGPIFDELVRILKKGRTLVEGYAASKGFTSTVVSRTDNREAFEEIHEELDTLEAKLGFQSLGGEVESSPAMEKFKMKDEAEKDKTEIPEIFSQMQSTGVDHSKELAQVVLEKIADVNIEKLVASDEMLHAGARSALPSYLTIDLKSDSIAIGDQRIREYVKQSNQVSEEDGWAKVHPGKWLGCDFAIKVFKCGAGHNQADQWNRRQLLMEVGSLVELLHPHVVRLVGFGQDEEQSVFVMELMDDDLRHFMKTKRKSRDKPFSDTEELDVVNQIAKGMYYMHRRGYAHGDLKCSNILVKNFDDHYLEVKISDLRGSQKLDTEWDPKAFEQASKTRRPRWTAPEAIDHYGGKQPSEELMKKSDVYSFGMTCYEIVTGKYPFDGIKAEDGGPLLEYIQEGQAEKWNQLPPELDEGLKGLIRSCWNKEPSERPSFENICLLLDIIRSKRLDAEKSKSSGVTVAAMLSQIKQIPASVKRAYTEVTSLVCGRSQQSEVELLRSYSAISAPVHLRIPSEELKRVGPIGLGSSGRVFKATWLGCTLAVKILKRHFNTQFLQTEVDFLIKVSRHPCIMQMVGLSVNSSGEHSIVMEYMDGDLQKLINSRMAISRAAKPFKSDEEVLIITKIAWGMAYLHSRGLVHRDLNPRNVLAQDYRTTVDVKIVDFGMSYLEETSNSSVRHGYFTGVGTGFYRAPEMLCLEPKEELPLIMKTLPDEADLNALKATDVYSFGMVCYKVLTGRIPCSDLQISEYAKVRGGHRPKWPLDPRPELKSLVERCWHTDPTERPTFIDICKDLQRHFQKQPRS